MNRTTMAHPQGRASTDQPVIPSHRYASDTALIVDEDTGCGYSVLDYACSCRLPA